MDLLKDDSKIYKLVGPVLLKVDSDEAKENVQKRIEFIEKELKKIEELTGTMRVLMFYSLSASWLTLYSYTETKQKEQNLLGNEIAEYQQQMQMDAAAAVNKAISA